MARPLRVVVIGSGPSGFYAAEALQRQSALPVQVDMLDRLPTPYGLVRGGVAPDHQKIKGVIVVYEKIASHPEFRFYGNLMLGRDVSAAELDTHYDAVIYAVGNESDKRMGIPGEDLLGSHPATNFVGWYNGHPDYREERFDLSAERAVVVGIGNVAMDVARILAEDPDVLAKTDIAGYALDALRKSRVREVYILGRRGPAQAAFSPAEIAEIGSLHGSDLVLLPEEARLDDVSREALSKKPDPEAEKNIKYLNEKAAQGAGKNPRKVHLRLCVSPVEVLGEGGRMNAVRIEKNKLAADDKGNVRPKGTGQLETLRAGLIFRSVGYNGVPIPGVPFDAKIGRIPNEAGRVVDEAKKPIAGKYVVGWAKRGPSGLVGTNRPCSVATVNALLEDFKGFSGGPASEKTREAAEALYRSRQKALFTFKDWKALDRIEVETGKKLGKVREKFTSVAEMAAALVSEKAAA